MNSLLLTQSALREQPNGSIAPASAAIPAAINPAINSVTNSPTNSPRRNGASEPPFVDVHKLLEPIRPGLQQVEKKMRPLDSSVFAPLANAFVELISSGGKRIRPALALLAAELTAPLQETPRYQPVLALAAAVEMLHTSSLVHDDVIDGALLRRGAPTLNATWSGGATVLAGTFMFATAAHLSAETGNIRVIHLFSDTLKVIVDGELRQLLARYNYTQEKAGYYERIYAKTASLFCAATEGAAVLTNLPATAIQQLHDFGYNFGMAFQIMDDILDFTGNEASLGKPAGSDLRQGTLTLPFFHFLQQHTAPQTVVERLEAARTQAEEGDPALWKQVVAQVVDEVCQSEGIHAARGEALEFLQHARATLSSFTDSVYKRSLLGLCDFVVQRTY
jgi:geranylgeranyl pyrophosphate synthase